MMVSNLKKANKHVKINIPAFDLVGFALSPSAPAYRVESNPSTRGPQTGDCRSPLKKLIISNFKVLKIIKQIE